MYNTLDTNRKGKHVIDTKSTYEYQKMLNQWESTGIQFKIIKEEFYRFETKQNLVLFHVVKFSS